MHFYQLTETAPDSGLFEFSFATIRAPSASAAIADLLPSVPAGLRSGVYPYRSMGGSTEDRPSLEAEVGLSYLVLEQSGGTVGLFALTSDQIDSTGDLDAGVAALQRQERTGLRVGLMLKPSAVAASTPSFVAPASASSPEHTGS